MPNDLNSLIQQFVAIIDNALLPIIIGLATVIFLYGLLKYIISKDEKTRNEAVSVITMGIIVLFVMVSVWGLVNLIGTIFSPQIYNPGSQDTPNSRDINVQGLIKN